MDSLGLNLAFWISLGLSLLLGIAGLVVPWRVGARKTFVSVTQGIDEILPALEGAGLDIRHGETVVRRPYLVSITFRNNGPSDIGPDDFVGGSLGFTFSHGELVTLIGDANPASVVAPGKVDLAPVLLAQGGSATLRALFDGEPDLTTTVRLKNVREGEAPTKRPAPASLYSFAALGLLVILATVTIVQVLLTTRPAGTARVLPSPGVATVIAIPSLNLRAKPSPESQVLSTLPTGSQVVLQCYVFGDLDGGSDRQSPLWYRTTVGSATGFVADVWLVANIDGVKAC